MAIISDTRAMPRVLFAALLFFAIPFWIFLAAPRLKRLPTDFRYEADIFSIDHFFGKEKERCLGPQISKTWVTYEVAKSQKTADDLGLSIPFDLRAVATIIMK